MGNKAYKQRHRKQGLCINCSRKALPGQIRCFLHNMSHKLWKEDPVKHRARNAKWKKYWEEHNLCNKCGGPLSELDRNFKSCMNCRSHIHRPRWAYWYELEARGIKFDRNLNERNLT